MTVSPAPARSSGVKQPPGWVKSLSVRGQNYIVELLKPAEKSSGGIWLPDRCQENWTHGVVRAAGPGEIRPVGGLINEEFRTTMFCQVGDEVIWQKHNYHSAGPPHTYGTVRDEDLVAIVKGAEIIPLNDWVAIAQDPDITDASSMIVYAEEWRPKPCSGIVTAFGPGKMQWKGEWWGVRKAVPLILGLCSADEWLTAPHYEAKFSDGERLTGTEIVSRKLIGKRVHWGRDHEMLSIGREHLEALLIEAGELLLLEED